MTDFVAEILVRKHKRKNSRFERQRVSIRFRPRKRVFGSWKQEKGEKKERMRERVLFIWSRNTPSDVVPVPLSTAQGWLDAYFVNIRTCEVKRNTKGHQQTKILMEWSCNQRRVEIFHFPIVFLLSVCGFRLLSFLFPHIGFDFLLIGTIKMRTQDKAPKDSRTEMTKQCRPKKLNTKLSLGGGTGQAVIESSIVSAF